MKNLFYLLAAVVLFSACKEKTITIPTLTVGKRRVLVEEGTGVRCVNCPTGARLLTDLREHTYGDSNLVVVSIHCGGGGLSGYSKPYSNSKYDFQTARGYAMVNNYIGVPDGFPESSIDRHKVGDGWFTPPVQWPGIIGDEFNQDYGLDLFVKNTFDAGSRELKVTVNIAPGQAQPFENHLSVVITQDSIYDLQLDGAVDTHTPIQYWHNHVFRDIITDLGGDVINEPLTAGALVTKTYTYTLPADWDEKHCHVVAFVHHAGTPDKDVLQVTEKKVIQ
jgi:hypothetical protein